jgi:hypothetical protein
MGVEEEVGGGQTSGPTVHPSRSEVHTDASQALPESSCQDVNSTAQSVLSQNEGATSIT